MPHARGAFDLSVEPSHACRLQLPFQCAVSEAALRDHELCSSLPSQGNGLYLMLIFVPIACMSETFHFSEAMVFFLSCLAILPLAGLLGEATEQVSRERNGWRRNVLASDVGKL